MTALCVWLLTACGSQPPKAGAGDYHFELVFQDHQRDYWVHIPPQQKIYADLPVVINFHGGGGNAKAQQAFSKMDDTADKHGFMVIYPNGTGRMRNRLLTWNAGQCCGYAAEHGMDDVGFIRMIVKQVSKKWPIDRNRIYATGMSNGAMMAYRLAVDAPDLVAAIAPVAGAMQMKNNQLNQSMAIMHFHSVDDPRALYLGGLGPAFPMTNYRVQHKPVESVLKHWALYNECDPAWVEMEGPISEKIDGNVHSATLWGYQGCKAGAEVMLWKLTGAGHVWPGGRQDYLTRVLGPSTTVINANERMWRFFSFVSARAKP